MTDILNFLRAYPDDPTLVMSKARVAETIAEIERLRAELAAERERVAAYQAHIIRCDNSLKQYQAERDALRELLREALNFMPFYTEELRARIDAALNNGDRDE